MWTSNRPFSWFATAVAAALAGLGAASSNLPSILMIGMPGTGKRTVAEHVADRVGIDFIELRLDLAAKDVAESLFGAQQQSSQRPLPLESGPGALGHAGPLLLYLSHIEGLDHGLFQPLANLLSTRTYVDGSGKSRKISDEIWLVCGLTPATSANVSPNHWLTSRFQLRFSLDEPRDPLDFQTVAANCSRRCSDKISLGDTVGTALLAMSPIPDNFHAVRRWIEAACTTSRDGTVDAAALSDAAINDLSWVLRKLEYRGKRLELKHVNKWLGQIPLDIRPLAVQLVRQLADKYFVTAGEYYHAVSVLTEQAAIPSGRVVSFCRWQPLGKSAAHISHELKNQGRWKVVEDIDFAVPESAWPTLANPNPVFVLTDDFVGTGGTLHSLTDLGEAAPVVRLSKKYPSASFVLLLLVAYEEPTAAAIKSLKKLLGARISAIVYKTLSATDQCFTPGSTILPPAKQALLKTLCISVRAKYFSSLPTKFVYGYEQTAAFFAFFNSVPNNSLPILWHDQANWFPLLPASKTLD